jgi:serralysin
MTTYTLTAQSDRFPGSASSDLAFGDVVEALAGDDIIMIFTSGISVFASDGADEIRVAIDAFASFESQFHGGNGNDFIEVRGRNHVINGDGGDDVLSLIGRDSIMNGGDGNDRLEDNAMAGRGYTSRYNGDSGNDTLVGNGGASTFAGGSGNDRYLVYGEEILIEAKNHGIDTVTTSNATYVLPLFFENLVLGRTAISGTGNGAANVIIGNASNNDLSGRSGNDRLTGAAGRDQLTGGTGKDIFDFNAVSDTKASSSGRDVIVDFTRGSDTIDLKTIDASTRVSGNNTFKFIASKAYSDLAGELRAVRFDRAGTADDMTIVAGDVNGDGSSDFQIQLTGLKVLTATDFIL